jgi:hypothetical protein
MIFSYLISKKGVFFLSLSSSRSRSTHVAAAFVFMQFNSLVRERRANFSSGSADPFPFEYCYRLG